MPLSSSLAPGFVRFAYTGSSEPHHAILPIDFDEPPVPGVVPSFNQNGGGTILFPDAMEAYLVAYAPMFNGAATSFGIAEVYAVDEDTGVRTFIYAINLDTPGGSIVAQVPLVEGVFVFKCTTGKPLKIYTMEGVFAADARNIGTPPAGVRADFVEYIVGDENFVRGRSNAFPQAFVSFTSKENDRLRIQSGFNNF